MAPKLWVNLLMYSTFIGYLKRKLVMIKCHVTALHLVGPNGKVEVFMIGKLEIDISRHFRVEKEPRIQWCIQDIYLVIPCLYGSEMMMSHTFLFHLRLMGLVVSTVMSMPNSGPVNGNFSIKDSTKSMACT